MEKDCRRGPREKTWTKRTPEERRAKHLAKSRRNYKQSNANKKAKRLAIAKTKEEKKAEALRARSHGCHNPQDAPKKARMMARRFNTGSS